MGRSTRVSFERWRPSGSLQGDTDRRWPLLEACFGFSHRPAEHSALAPRRAALLRDVHPAAVDDGLVDLSTLKAGGTLLSFAYGFHHDGVVELVHVGLAPGATPEAIPVLLGRLIRDSFERGDQQIIFGPLCVAAGAGWGNATRFSFRYTHFAPAGACAQVLRLNHCMRRWLRLDPTVAEPIVQRRERSVLAASVPQQDTPRTLRLPTRAASP
ncbi:MAG TPA: GNAT family N-acetyltransferase [Planctomycetaceae bacterium]|nr:GNAT family N-acetyltransferase [Planctomycetaceae bacterium]